MEVEATFRPRSGNGYQLKEGVAAFTGQKVLVTYAWPIEDDLRPQYAGEDAWMVRQPDELGRLVAWVASGDLEFPAPAPN
jgi:hypothetical protein